MAMKDRFANIFGNDAAEDYWSAAPTLASVLPSLVDTSRSGQFTSQELNRRAEGVRGGRKTRAARTRSAGAFLPTEVAQKMQNTSIFDQPSRGPDEAEVPTYVQNAQIAEPDPGGGADYQGYGGGDQMYNEGQRMMGDEVLGNLGSNLGTNAAMMTAAGVGLGAPLMDALPSALGQSVAGVFGPMSILNMADNFVGTHQAIGEAQTAANMFPAEEQMDVMQGVFQSQPHAVSSRLMADAGLWGDEGLQMDEMSQLATNQMTQPEIMDMQNQMSMEQPEMSMMSPGELEQQRTNLELQQNVAEYNQPSMVGQLLSNMGLEFGTPDQAAIEGAGSMMTESGAFDRPADDPNNPRGGFTDVNNVSDQYSATGQDPFGEGTYSRNINEQPSPTAQPGAITDTDVNVKSTAGPMGIQETGPDIVSSKPEIQKNLEAEKLEASTVASDAARAKEKAAADKKAADQQAGLEKDYKTAEKAYNDLVQADSMRSEKQRDNHSWGGKIREAKNKMIDAGYASGEITGQQSYDRYGFRTGGTYTQNMTQRSGGRGIGRDSGGGYGSGSSRHSGDMGDMGGDWT